MSFNLSLMECGLADRVQSQTHLGSTLLPRPTCPAHTAPSTGLSSSCSHWLLLLFQDHFWKDTELKLVCFPAFYSLLQGFLFSYQLWGRLNQDRSLFIAYRRKTLLYFMVTEPQINLSWHSSVPFFFHFAFPYFNFHIPHLCSLSYSLCFSKGKTSI